MSARMYRTEKFSTVMAWAPRHSHHHGMYSSIVDATSRQKHRMLFSHQADIQILTCQNYSISTTPPIKHPNNHGPWCVSCHGNQSVSLHSSLSCVCVCAFRRLTRPGGMLPNTADDSFTANGEVSHCSPRFKKYAQIRRQSMCVTYSIVEEEHLSFRVFFCIVTNYASK
jgi:hypothetical protein